MSNEEKKLFACDDDEVRYKLLSYADIPKKWYEEDYVGNLDHYKLMDILNETTAHVDDSSFEDGMPGGSGHYYTVYVRDEEDFRRKVTEKVLALFKETYGDI